MFDVKTGTLLFTVYERVEESVQESIWQNARKRRALKRRLLETAATGLAEKALAKSRRLVRGRGHAEAVDTASMLTEGSSSR